MTSSAITTDSRNDLSARTGGFTLLVVMTAGLCAAPLIVAAVARAPKMTSIPPQFADLTPLGRANYRPEHELKVYLPVMFAGMACLGWWGAVLLRGRAPSNCCRSAALLAFTGAVGGLATFLMILLLHSEQFAARMLVPLALATGPFATLGLAAAGYLSFGADHVPPGRTGIRGRLAWLASVVLIPAGIILYLHVPDPQEIVASQGYVLTHHWDYFVFSPMWGYLSGRPLVAWAYSQYGVGWPLTFAALSHFTAVDYALAVRVAALVQGIYFCGLYGFLRTWLKSTAAAVCGTALAIGLQVHCGGVDCHKLMTPSSTVMRYFGDIIVFWMCLRHYRSGRAHWKWGIGAILGVQCVFTLDAGIWLTAAVFAYLILTRLAADPAEPAGAANKRAVGLCARVLAVQAVVIAGGYFLATHGTLFSPGAAGACLAALKAHAAGISALPLSNLPNSQLATLIAVIAVYLLAVPLGVSAAAARRQSPLVIATVIAVYGAGTLTLLISRSAWQNLFHVAVPFALIVTAVAHEAYRRLAPVVAPVFLQALQGGVSSPALGAAQWVLAGWFCVGMGLVTQAHTYPGIARSLARRVHDSRRSSEPENQFAPLAARQSQIGEMVRDLVRQGRRVGVIADVEAWCLIDAGLPPVFRFSPCFSTMITRERAAAAVADIEAAGVDALIIQDGLPNDARSDDSLSPDDRGLPVEVPEVIRANVETARQFALSLAGFERVAGRDGVSVYLRRIGAQASR